MGNNRECERCKTELKFDKKRPRSVHHYHSLIFRILSKHKIEKFSFFFGNSQKRKEKLVDKYNLRLYDITTKIECSWH